jgi:hypothetical protein
MIERLLEQVKALVESIALRVVRAAVSRTWAGLIDREPRAWDPTSDRTSALIPSSRLIQKLYECGRIDEAWNRGLHYLSSEEVSRTEKLKILVYLRSIAYQRGRIQDLDLMRTKLHDVAYAEYGERLAQIPSDVGVSSEQDPHELLALIRDMKDRAFALFSDKRLEDSILLHRTCLALVETCLATPGFPFRDELRKFQRIELHNVGDTLIALARSHREAGTPMQYEDFLLLGAESQLERSLEIQKTEGRVWGITVQSLLQSCALRRDFGRATTLLDDAVTEGGAFAQELGRILDGHRDEIADLTTDPECFIRIESLIAAGRVTEKRKRGFKWSLFTYLVLALAVVAFAAIAARADNMAAVSTDDNMAALCIARAFCGFSRPRRGA